MLNFLHPVLAASLVVTHGVLAAGLLLGGLLRVVEIRPVEVLVHVVYSVLNVLFFATLAGAVVEGTPLYSIAQWGLPLIAPLAVGTWIKATWREGVRRHESALEERTRDLTAQIEADARGRRELEILQAFVQGLPEAVAVLGPTSERCPLRIGSREWGPFHGHPTTEEITGLSHWDVNNIPPEWQDVHYLGSVKGVGRSRARDLAWGDDHPIAWEMIPLPYEHIGFWARELGPRFGALTAALRVGAPNAPN